MTSNLTTNVQPAAQQGNETSIVIENLTIEETEADNVKGGSLALALKEK